MPDMDDLIRQRAGRAPAPDPDGPPRRTSFDGGARAPAPQGPPSPDAMMRAEREEHRSRVTRRARHIERWD